jgi:hypothetical protein
MQRLYAINTILPVMLARHFTPHLNKDTRAIFAGLHHGTVDSSLTKPFQKNIPKGQLFTADYSASKLLAILFELSPESSGKLFAWDGQEVNP